MRKGMKAMLMVALAGGAATAQVARPNALWFNKVITPERSRQLYVGLNQNMWILYDLPQCVIYQAWMGAAAGGSLVMASVTVSPGYWFGGGPHFPHMYVTSGTNFFKDQVGEYFATYTVPSQITTYYTRWPAQPLNYHAWTVRNASGLDVGAVIRFRGYTVPGNVFTLRFGLVLPGNGGEITVTESPEYSNAGGRNNLVRTLTFAGIPAGYQVRLEHLGGAAGNWVVTSGSATLLTGAMVQTANGQTILTGSW